MRLSKKKVMIFQESLLDWYERNRRAYIWREYSDPYKILVSEIMLQKTNADRVAQIYPQFMQRFPDTIALARSEVEELKLILKPLGLDYRAARLKDMAQRLVAEYGGEVPVSEETLLALPGVGQYIANAVLCFAYSNRVPLVDINVVRLYERVFSLRFDKKRAREDPKIWEFATEMMPMNGFRKYNRALIDFGAKICMSKNPRCAKCTVSFICNYSSGQYGGN
jgi:A/G-specific adenine glycosylase